MNNIAAPQSLITMFGNTEIIAAKQLIEKLADADLFEETNKTEGPTEINGEDWNELYGWNPVEGDWTGWTIEFNVDTIVVEKATYWEPGWAYNRTWFLLTTPTGKTIEGEHDTEYGLTLEGRYV
jgi:hypothetical protein